MPSVYNLQKQDFQMSAQSYLPLRTGSLAFSTVGTVSSLLSPVRKDKRPISTFDITGSSANFQNNHSPYNAKSTLLIPGAKRTALQMLRSSMKVVSNRTNVDDVRELGVPASRSPLKIRNLQQKPEHSYEVKGKGVTGEYDFSRKGKTSFENNDQPLKNKIIQKLQDKQKIINELKELAATQLPTRKRKNTSHHNQRLLTIKDGSPIVQKESPYLNEARYKPSAKENMLTLPSEFQSSNPEDKKLQLAKKGLYFTPKLNKMTSTPESKHFNSSTRACSPLSPMPLQKDYSPIRKTFQKYTDASSLLRTENTKVLKRSQFKKHLSLSDFKLVKKLGQGKFGTVFTALHYQTGALFALKRISKEAIRSHMMIDQLIVEIRIQSYIHHKNIVRLYSCFDDKDHLYLVLEYLEEGTLFDLLKKSHTLKEEEVAEKVTHVAEALKELHDKGIAHRDVKPENIVMSNGVGKLCDFGWAAICNERRRTYCGTFDYAAPEILEGSEYDMSVDMWCLGVLAYQLLVGKAPFYNISRKETMKKIKNVASDSIEFPASLSRPAVNFIDALLRKNPEERMTAHDVLQHPFLVQNRIK